MSRSRRCGTVMSSSDRVLGHIERITGQRYRKRNHCVSDRWLESRTSPQFKELRWQMGFISSRHAVDMQTHLWVTGGILPNAFFSWASPKKTLPAHLQGRWSARQSVRSTFPQFKMFNIWSFRGDTATSSGSFTSTPETASKLRWPAQHKLLLCWFISKSLNFKKCCWAL